MKGIRGAIGWALFGKDAGEVARTVKSAARAGGDIARSRAALIQSRALYPGAPELQRTSQLTSDLRRTDTATSIVSSRPHTGRQKAARDLHPAAAGVPEPECQMCGGPLAPGDDAGVCAVCVGGFDWWAGETDSLAVPEDADDGVVVRGPDRWFA